MSSSGERRHTCDVLTYIVKLVSSIDLPIDLLHRVVFCSFARAGLALFKGAKSRKAELELESLEKTVPHWGLSKGELYLSALRFIRSLNEMMEGSIMPREANIRFVLDSLKEKVGKVDGVIVLDCGSIPEISTIAGKFARNRSVSTYDIVFANPAGMTKFLTEQLVYLGRKNTLKDYAELLKKELGAEFGIKIPTIDLTVHQYGVDVGSFLNSLDMKKIFEQVNNLARRGSVLITADHGYDLVADEHGLYITHGYKKECPLNFSKIAPFIVVD